jgi:glycosyltransferase involved in cell wall biosynthesis
MSSVVPCGKLGVVMAVYGGVRPEHLRRALSSLAEQTRPANEVVVVEDGPLSPELDKVLGTAPPELSLRRVCLRTNQGAGPARQAGLNALTTRWVAIADADDVSLPDRFAVQLAWLESSGDSAVGASMAEFEGPEDRVIGIRRLPPEHDMIARRLRMNNPVNHPTLMVDRRRVLEVGGYQDLPYLEDYDLMARLVASGARLHNLPDVLVRFRTDESTYSRRTSREVARAERRLQQNLRSYGLISVPRMCANYALRNAFRRLPRPLLKKAYDVLLRQSHPSRAPGG